MKVEKKLDSWCWFFIQILPIILIFISFFHTGYDFTIQGSIDNYVVSLFTQFHFTPIYNILLSVFRTYFDIQMTSGIYIICAYFSYLFFIELVHILYSALIFIFRLARRWIEGVF